MWMSSLPPHRMPVLLPTCFPARPSHQADWLASSQLPHLWDQCEEPNGSLQRIPWDRRRIVLCRIRCWRSWRRIWLRGCGRGRGLHRWLGLWTFCKMNRLVRMKDEWSQKMRLWNEWVDGRSLWCDQSRDDKKIWRLELLSIKGGEVREDQADPLYCYSSSTSFQIEYTDNVSCVLRWKIREGLHCDSVIR